MIHHLSEAHVEDRMEVDIPDEDMATRADDDDNSDDMFDRILRYFREPFDPSDLSSFDRRIEVLEGLKHDLRAQMANLAERERELAREKELVNETYEEEGEEYDQRHEDMGDMDVDEELAPDNEEEAHEHEHEEEQEEEQAGEGGRRRRPLKPRVPYTQACAVRRTNWFSRSLEWHDNDFRDAYRISKDTFWGIVQILQRNPIFQSKGQKPQRPVHYQFAVFLLRYGTAGSHERHPRLQTGIGAGTVSLYCRRVVRAIREFGVGYIAWPDNERKDEIKRGFKRLCGLDGIIGALDGTLCGLETKPRVDGNSYISRKKTLSVNVQAIVDHKGQFIAFQSGWPGSRPDIAIWPHMWVYLQRRNLFANGEHLLADGGYPLSPYVLIPFKKNELRPDYARRRDFNQKITRARIVVEWAFGRLKWRFPALKRLGANHEIRDTYRAIEAMMILHNLCFDFGDTPEYSRARPNDEDEGEGESEEEEEDDEAERDRRVAEDERHQAGGDARESLRMGRALRERCMDIICPRT